MGEKRGMQRRENERLRESGDSRDVAACEWGNVRFLRRGSEGSCGVTTREWGELRYRG